MQTQFSYRGHRVELNQTKSDSYDGSLFVIYIDGFEQKLDPGEESGLPLTFAIDKAKKLIDWFENTTDQSLGRIPSDEMPY